MIKKLYKLLLRLFKKPPAVEKEPVEVVPETTPEVPKEIMIPTVRQEPDKPVKLKTINSAVRKMTKTIYSKDNRIQRHKRRLLARFLLVKPEKLARVLYRVQSKFGTHKAEVLEKSFYTLGYAIGKGQDFNIIDVRTILSYLEFAGITKRKHLRRV